MIFPKTNNHLPDGWTITVEKSYESAGDACGSGGYHAEVRIDGVKVAICSDYYSKEVSVYVIADQYRDLIEATLKKAAEMDVLDFLKESRSKVAEKAAKREAAKAEANAAIDAWISKRGWQPLS